MSGPGVTSPTTTAARNSRLDVCSRPKKDRPSFPFKGGHCLFLLPKPRSDPEVSNITFNYLPVQLITMRLGRQAL